MDFAALPPEINSARMYSGPGPTSLLAAATAWDRLAGELTFSASSCTSVVANLTGSVWQGAASTRMADAVLPYVAWLHATAQQATQVGAQAKAAVAAYEVAFAGTVPPPLIEANRARLMSLIATNFFGQNSPAIAATEAEYEAMWAQDAATMYRYAASAASVTQNAPFDAPPQTTNPVGDTTGAAAAAQAVATSVNNAQSGTASTLLGLAQPAAGPPSSGMIPVIAGESITSYLFQAGSYGRFGFSINNQIWRMISLGARLAGWQSSAVRDFANGVGPYAPLYGIPLAATGSAESATAPAAAAVVGQASQVNSLSVPPNWAATTTAAGLTSPPSLPATAVAPAAVITGQAGSAVFGDALLGTLAGRAISALASRQRGHQARPANTVIPKCPAGG
ncbi:PPE family protein [[Mycobacterium] crassicus]|uniref:PPE family protein n=1 Tax=[Mycobacterium] crassicus TaxID=2872309 RepID=A0ABU5XPP6_9MYCO|nr:PPE family protein [Mycolicibacter sp. MYC098]MEB3024189.1 PPE family protein [Mycolicibacter sp. MYC098]